MSIFNEGDRVRLTSEGLRVWGTDQMGRGVGVITKGNWKAYSDRVWVRVLWDGGKEYSYFAYCVEFETISLENE